MSVHTEERAAWDRAAFATGRGDDVEGAVRQAYREAGLPDPEHVITVASPLAGARAAARPTAGAARREQPPSGSEATRVEAAPEGPPIGVVAAPDGLPVGVVAGRSVRHEVRTLPWERARAVLSAELGPAGWAARWTETGGRLWPQVSRLVADVRRAVADAGGDELRRVTLDAVLGQHDAPWLSAFDAPGGRPDAHDDEPWLSALGGLKRVAGCAGWWWPYERVAIVSARPTELHLDELGRLHAAGGPALAYSDGFALHAWHGMPVPADFTMTDLTPRRIREEANAELRRVMLEHFGLDRYLAESGARPEHSDETGVLWRIELPDDEPIAMVEVVNSTPEPDGTRRTYFLRVPPWVRRAREGVAWTFGVSEDDYRPARET
ncbi:DUF6745 domain-containing protein [Nonomuraea sp. SBT364]|uniref:DUF6745 domain-containing protein n=1 Tax=Nonomuraea sp. SBT364 TaxID=1580530 RepID=UPI00066E172C|nr:hypothetical protein [Nonomuraea sp. SBT364]